MPKENNNPTSSYGLTDIGSKRERNEDNFCIDDDIGFYLVADGMGGHANGDVASEMTTQYILRQLVMNTQESQHVISPDKAKDTLQYAITETNTAIYTKNRELGRSIGSGMGSAIAGLWLIPGNDNAWIFHAGDCRVYLFRNNALRQLTKDHTFYEQWVSDGRDGPAPNKNIILRALGPWPNITIDFQLFEPEHEDVILICSDGLTDMVSDEAIMQELCDSSTQNHEQTVRNLISLANTNGGKDNITVVLTQFNCS